MEPVIRSHYNPGPRVKTVITGKSRTKQSFQDETNINKILAKYDAETIEEQLRKNPGAFLDLPSGLDYQTAANMAINARASFDELPGTIRARFQNNPEYFLRFMDEESNEKEIVAMGLREAKEVPPAPSPTVPAPVVEPAPNIEPVPE